LINEPHCIVSNDFQNAWLEAIRHLVTTHWELRNLVVHIKNPGVLDQSFHIRLEAFAKAQRILGPKHVAYTIFPYRLYARKGAAGMLFQAYNRHDGLYERLHRRKPGWGTYFRRMTLYEGRDGPINQLDRIIDAIRNRTNLSRAAYAILIQHPGGETVRPRGGPCLNYIAVQAESGPPLSLGLLAVYRNHDFLERAYGNYWGLCNLLLFLAKETGGTPGPLTCVSSHAYVAGSKTALKQLVEGF